MKGTLRFKLTEIFNRIGLVFNLSLPFIIWWRHAYFRFQDSILQLPMMLAEERILVDFLLNSDEKKINRKETLLLYYLQVIVTAPIRYPVIQIPFPSF